MTTPRVKRSLAGAASDPAQRPITSFFARDAASDRPASSHLLPARMASPPLPPSVQANLLAVGMRVRKSVPEGYKTGKEAGTITKTACPALAAPAARELLPFCGLHRVGGLDVQTWEEVQFAPAVFAGEDDDQVPGLTSSQDTVVSEDEPASRKRLHGSDDGDDVDVAEDEDEDVSSAAFYQLGRRVLAVPRRRQKHHEQLIFKSTRPVDQENGRPGEDDFAEADFLKVSAWSERDFEMGDAEGW